MEDDSSDSYEGVECEDAGCYLCTDEYIGETEERCMNLIESMATVKLCCGPPAVSIAPAYEYTIGTKGSLSTKRRMHCLHDTRATYLVSFAKQVGSARQVSNIIAQYKQYKVNKQVPEQDALLTMCIESGLSQMATRLLFRIGQSRYCRLKEKRESKVGCGNGNQVTQEMKDYFKKNVDTWHLEEGFACLHRRQKLYLPSGSSWKKLWKSYVRQCEIDKVRSMKYTTWLKYKHAIYPTIDIQKIKEDCCDVCEKFAATLADPHLPVEEKEKVCV